MIILILLFFFSNLYSAGFAGNTLLLTNNGYIRFDEVGYDTFIKSHENTQQPVLFFAKQSVAKVVQINIANEQIVCHKKQLFWCVNKNNWLCAQDLLPGDLLQTVDSQYMPIDAVEIVEQQTKMYSLSVGPPHYLYVGKHAILAHNVAWFVGIGVTLAIEKAAVEFMQWSFFLAIGALVCKIQNHFAKNRGKKKTKVTMSVQPMTNGSGNFNPDDKDDFFTKLKNRTKKCARTNKFGKMYQDPETGLWWSKDLAQHGGSYFKVFKETAKSFEWIFNADHMGNRIFGQNKGPIGMSIPFKEVIFKT